MDAELKNVRNLADRAQQWFMVAGAVMRLCDYIAKLIDGKIAKLEARIEKLERERDGEPEEG